MSIAKDGLDTSPRPALSQGITSHQQPRSGEMIGKLIIPRIGAILPIVEGTSPDDLAKGVGHYVGYGTVMPGETGHVVLSGHRDTVFRRMGEVRKGDKLYVQTADGMFVYQVRTMWVTDANDRTVIVPLPKPILTLTTCYPFDYVGSAPDRYIVRAELIGIDLKKKMVR
jgi:sortase A